MFKENPPRFVINKGNHVHAALKRGKYFAKPEIFTEYALFDEADGVTEQFVTSID